MSMGADLQANPVCLQLLSLVCSSVFNCSLQCGDSEVQGTAFQKTQGAKDELKNKVLNATLHIVIKRRTEETSKQYEVIGF